MNRERPGIRAGPRLTALRRSGRRKRFGGGKGQMVARPRHRGRLAQALVAMTIACVFLLPASASGVVASWAISLGPDTLGFAASAASADCASNYTDEDGAPKPGSHLHKHCLVCVTCANGSASDRAFVADYDILTGVLPPPTRQDCLALEFLIPTAPTRFEASRSRAPPRGA